MINKETIKPPQGLLLLGFRMPVWLYRLGIGGILGKRMIYFEHTGRKSGLLCRSVIEVIRLDQENDAYYAVSAYGERADWFRNLMHTPRLKAQVGWRRFQAQVERLSQKEALAEFEDYARRHPKLLKNLGGLLGLKLKGTQEELVHLSEIMPVIVFRPVG